MSWVSERHLVAALSNSGAFGVIACGSMPPALLRAEIQATRALTSHPFGVNLIVMHPELETLLAVCVEEQVSHVVFAGGMPRAAHLAQLQEREIKSLGFAPTLTSAKRLIKHGIGALIIEGTEAGGHIGPVATSVLAQEILPHVTEVPVFVAGGIGRGETIASYLELGASGCQLGTRFVCAEESIAHPRFKECFIRSQARDAVPSVQLDPDFPVIPVRAIANQASKAFTHFQRETIEKHRTGLLSKEAAQLEIEHFWAGALRRAVIDGDVEQGSVMAGQSVGMVTAIEPMQQIIDRLVAEAVRFLECNG